MTSACRICGTQGAEFGRMQVMGKHEAVYDLCPQCGYLQARDPFWLAESYESPITRTDIGSVNRCVTNAAITRLIISFFLHSRGPFLDYGAGYGMFVRHMRDYGYDFWYQDSYCQNLFAEDFIVDGNSKGKFELVTAFEVFEHMAQPAEDIKHILQFGRRILFTTELLPQPLPPMGQWWYHAPDHGQHIGFFARRTLEYLADKHNLHLATNGSSVHYLGKDPLSGRTFRWLLHRRAKILLPFCRRPSLLMSDYDARRQRAFQKLGQEAPPR